MASSGTSFKKGEGGRPKGARNKVTKIYLDALACTTKAEVLQVVDKLKEKHPDAYLKHLGALVPKDLDVNLTGNINISVIDYAEGDE